MHNSGCRFPRANSRRKIERWKAYRPSRVSMSSFIIVLATIHSCVSYSREAAVGRTQKCSYAVSVTRENILTKLDSLPCRESIPRQCGRSRDTRENFYRRDLTSPRRRRYSGRPRGKHRKRRATRGTEERRRYSIHFFTNVSRICREIPVPGADQSQRRWKRRCRVTTVTFHCGVRDSIVRLAFAKPGKFGRILSLLLYLRFQPRQPHRYDAHFFRVIPRSSVLSICISRLRRQQRMYRRSTHSEELASEGISRRRMRRGNVELHSASARERLREGDRETDRDIERARVKCVRRFGVEEERGQRGNRRISPGGGKLAKTRRRRTVARVNDYVSLWSGKQETAGVESREGPAESEADSPRTLLRVELFPASIRFAEKKHARTPSTAAPDAP